MAKTNEETDQDKFIKMFVKLSPQVQNQIIMSALTTVMDAEVRKEFYRLWSQIS